MAKKKKDLDKKRDEFLNQARDGLKELKDCDFKEFKEHMILLGEQLLAANFMIMEWVGEERNKIFYMAVDEVKKVRATNDKDFKIAEKNFKKMDNVIESFMHQAARAESASMVSLMRSLAIGNLLARKGVIEDEHEAGEMGYLSEKCLKFVQDYFEFKPKEFYNLMKKASEATA